MAILEKVLGAGQRKGINVFGDLKQAVMKDLLVTSKYIQYVLRWFHNGRNRKCCDKRLVIFKKILPVTV